MNGCILQAASKPVNFILGIMTLFYKKTSNSMLKINLKASTLFDRMCYNSIGEKEGL